MANKRIDQLTAGAGIAFTSLVEVCDDPGAGNFHRKYTIQQIFDFIGAALGFVAFATTDLLRAGTNFQDGRLYFRLGDVSVDDGNTVSYRFDAVSMDVDDGLSVIKPTYIDVANPGRLKQVNL